MVVSINATVTRGSLLVMQYIVLHGQSCGSSQARFSSSGAMPVPECATSRPSEKDAATPWNTRVDNIFRVYSVGRGRRRGQFSRDGVALIAVVHREFASVPSSSLIPVILTGTSSTRLLFSRFPPVSSRPSSSPFATILHQNLFVPRREKHAAVHAATLSALICAQQERRKLMHVAHAGRESVGSLSSRTPALTRIHHHAAGSSDERRIVRRVVPLERGGRLPLAKDSPDRLLILITIFRNNFL